MTWAKEAREVIDTVRINTGLSGAELRKELRYHYPFDDKSGFPYKTWLNEVADVCGRSRKTKSDTLDMFDNVPEN